MNNIDLTRYKRIVQYFWDPEPQNSGMEDSSIWCLGLEYHANRTARTAELQRNNTGRTVSESRNIASPHNEQRPDESKVSIIPPSTTEPDLTTETQRGDDTGRGWPKDFLLDFESKIWMTYRSDFPPIARSKDSNAASVLSLTVRLRSQLGDLQGFTSDTGWGCMIRSGQSLLANALIVRHLGRDWRVGSSALEEKRIINLFADDPLAPFSIHRFVWNGASVCGKHPGEWFGPSATARCIQDLASECKAAGLRVHVTSDSSDVYEDRFMQAACSDDGVFHPTLILLGIRLGIDRVTPVYWEALKAALQLPQSIGIAGGRPSASHYFVGVQGPCFFYLDPHHTRPAIPYQDQANDHSLEEAQSFHTRRLRRLHIQDMDPSMLIGFLIRNQEDWKQWRSKVSEVQGKPIVNIFDSMSSPLGDGHERQGAVDEVETLSDED